jgi:hypothetical protein
VHLAVRRSFLPRSPRRESAPCVSMHLGLPERDSMRTVFAREIGLMSGWRGLEATSNRASFHTPTSDSIGIHFRIPSVPQGEGQRKTQNAGSTGASIPCLRTPYSKQSFYFWNQPVDALSEDCLRQLEMRSACPEEIGGEMATRSDQPAARLNSVLPGSLHTENALFEANPEV